MWGLSFSVLAMTTLDDFSLSAKTWTAVALAWSSFILAALTVGFARVGISKSWQKRPVLALSKHYKTILTFIGILSLIGSIRFILVIMTKIGLRTWMENPIACRHLFASSGKFSSGMLTYVFQGINMAGASLGGIFVACQPRFLPAYLPLFSAALFDVFFLGRAHTIVTTIIFLTSFALSRDSKQKNKEQSRVGNSRALTPQAENNNSLGKKFDLQGKSKFRTYSSYFLVLLLVGGLFGYTSYIRGSLDKEEKASEKLSKASRAYIINLSQHWYQAEVVLEKDKALTMGVNSFFVPTLLLYKLGLRETDPRTQRLFSEAHSVPLISGRASKSNVYTLVGSTYADFGMAGLFFMPYIMGLISNSLFVLYQQHNRVWQIVSLSFIYPVLVFTIQGSLLGSTSFNTAVVIAAGLTLVVD